MVELMTIREAAVALRVSPITVRRYVACGCLSAVRVGRGVRLRRESMERFLEPVQPVRQTERVAEPQAERRGPGQPFTLDDPLWDILGIGRSDVAGDYFERAPR